MKNIFPSSSAARPLDIIARFLRKNYQSPPTTSPLNSPTISAPTTITISSSASANPFTVLSDDILLNIILPLEPDPRDWARLACVSSRFSFLIRHVCCRAKCLASTHPSVFSDLLSDGGSGGWAAFHKLSVCCPGLLHSGVLLDNSDFGLARDIGPHDESSFVSSSSSYSLPPPLPTPPEYSGWSLFDDLYSDTVYDTSEANSNYSIPSNYDAGGMDWEVVSKRRRKDIYNEQNEVGVHLAEKGWNLSSEEGRKLLASRFRNDCLYVSEWPGCVHAEKGRNREYMLFRGVFKDFKRSTVWRTINDGNRRMSGLSCAFCACDGTWDLLAAFCLKRVFGYHDDGEPVVRAFVCENGHVSGAWTERPLYT